MKEDTIRLCSDAANLGPLILRAGVRDWKGIFCKRRTYMQETTYFDDCKSNDGFLLSLKERRV